MSVIVPSKNDDAARVDESTLDRLLADDPQVYKLTIPLNH